MAQAVSRRPPTTETRVRSGGQSMWDLWWTKWHWDSFFPEYFGFPLLVSLHRCSITRKRTKNNNNHHRHLHHRVAQEASRLWCVRSVCCGAVHQLKLKYVTSPPNNETDSLVFLPLIFLLLYKPFSVRRLNSLSAIGYCVQENAFWCTLCAA
jgi:hypothetical protein